MAYPTDTYASDGFVRLAALVPRVRLADPAFNAEAIIESLREAHARGVDIASTPELGVTGYSCADLFMSETLLHASDEALRRIAEASREMPGLTFAVGAPVVAGAGIYNCAVVINNGRVVAVVPKTHLPNYGEFYERRWFTAPAPGAPAAMVTVAGMEAPMKAAAVIDVGGLGVSLEICEDLWAPVPPSSQAALRGAEIVLNLSASNDLVGKRRWLKELITTHSGRLHCAYVYAGAGFGESTTDTVYDGKAIIACNGAISRESERWSLEPSMAIADIDISALRHDRRRDITFASQAPAGEGALAKIQVSPAEPNSLEYITVDPAPFVPSSAAVRNERCSEISSIQALGLARRLQAARARTAVVGISGGLDSTLALLVAARAMDILGRPRTDIIGVTMPCFGTTGRTYHNALALMVALGVTQRDVDIKASVMQHFADIGQDPEVHDVTYENGQARERTQVLMDIANLTGGIVVGTGDLSELALGWATYNGDHMSMYGVNGGVPKTLVSYLVGWYADNAEGRLEATLRDILATPVSPELVPPNADGTIAQCTEEIVGPYRLHDFFLYHTLRHGASPAHTLRLARKAFAGEYTDDAILATLKKFVGRFFSQQFKRSCLPDGPKVGTVSLSPRADWRMPSDAAANAWLADL